MKEINNFAEYTMPTIGRHTCRVTSFELVTPEVEGKQPYIAVILLGNDVPTFETRIYSARVPYFMSAVARQTKGATGGMKLSNVLDYLMAHDFDVWVDYNDYGIQVNYTAPRK